MTFCKWLFKLLCHNTIPLNEMLFKRLNLLSIIALKFPSVFLLIYYQHFVLISIIILNTIILYLLISVPSFILLLQLEYVIFHENKLFKTAVFTQIWKISVISFLTLFILSAPSLFSGTLMPYIFNLLFDFTMSLGLWSFFISWFSPENRLGKPYFVILVYWFFWILLFSLPGSCIFPLRILYLKINKLSYYSF